MTVNIIVRRLLAVLCVTALLIGAFSVMAVAATSDINGDGVTDTSDVRVLLLSLVGNKPLTDEQQQQADLDGDGAFDSTDIRLLLTELIRGTTTQTTVTSTRPMTTYTTADPTTTLLPTTTTWVLTGPEGTAPTTYPTTTNTTWYDCVSTNTTTYPTTTNTTVPDCVSTNTTVPTTMPYGSFTISVGNVSAHGGDTIIVPIKISRDHALVGFEMDIQWQYGRLTLKTVSDDARNLYASNLNPAVFNDSAQWRFTQTRDGVLNVRYVSAAEEGSLESGTLFYLTFEVAHVSRDIDSVIQCDLLTYSCCANRTDYIPPANIVDGTVSITPGTTAEPTTTTCLPTTAVTTLPYGDPLCYTGETETVRVGNTFDWSIAISKNHSLVGLEMDIYYDPDVLTWIPDGTIVNDTIFDSNAQWRITQTDIGTLTLRYVSSADTGDAAGGTLLSLQFLLRYDTMADDTWIYLSPISTLSAVNGFTYYATEGTITDGYIQVASRSTRPPTRTTTTDTGTTDTTYPPTTTTTWVLTGPEGTAPTTYPTTTTTVVYAG